MSTRTVFRSGSLVGELRLTQVERLSMRPGARNGWTPRLALLDKDGRWLTTLHWRSNAWKKAERELVAMGWVKDEWPW